jgi:hypothetical protein
MRELENSFNPITPTSIVSYVNVQSISHSILIADKKQEAFASTEEFIYYLTHEVNNKIHKNGRIYMKIDTNGQLYANSVSPYSESFLANIEEGIKPVVLALKNKRYLTYSSCEGHGNSFRRYVGLAFADIESRTYVADYISGLGIPGVKIKLLDSVANNPIDINSGKNIKFLDKINPLDCLTEEHKQSETDMFNIQFHRKYDNYLFMELIILEEIPVGKFWKSPLKHIWLFIMKRYFLDKITQKVTNSIQNLQFKKYPY